MLRYANEFYITQLDCLEEIAYLNFRSVKFENFLPYARHKKGNTRKHAQSLSFHAADCFGVSPLTNFMLLAAADVAYT